MGRKYRARVDDRTVSIAMAVLSERAEDEKFGAAAQAAAKAALQFLIAADTLMDVCTMVAKTTPADKDLSGGERRRIAEVYTKLPEAVRETLETDVVQPIEILTVLGISLAPDAEDAEAISEMADGLGISTDELVVNGDDDEDDQDEDEDA